MNEYLGQSDFEDLSAWLDGELTGERAAQVERLVSQDPAWARAAEELRSLNEAMDGYAAPTPDADLAGRILAGISARELSESEIEQISAYMDGELPTESAEAVAASLRDHPAWRETLQDMRDVDSLLDQYTAPAPAAGLAERIVAGVRRERNRRRLLRAGGWLAPVAAAAAVLIGVALLDGWRQPPVNPQPNPTQTTVSLELQDSVAFEGVPVKERKALDDEIARNLDFFQDYEVVVDFETLEAIEEVENEARGI